ncbi:GntR family transcriptional regulator [Pseudonocardia sp. KRD-184]|uniref:GntR family transcriptional regulator n=1 Tax=Pseudonocardia oceani TaxID=2792013 RepID=A0ABS6U893_9PSEU|nr:GntR family transcriptional regulator [Pseudonocardia oceani]MBW0091534.1 GntR family transcriptional regulator [Pseudonocardia oceani]MBW0098655.1 GntR family transcriptional regulator [Pseudonocardia oceani]MBW0111188.1 GntR family transcriptional regulator [Pseudonocardia oceani]MBW0124130.1 GntR family transcriptional regulator [Pseudonocardia oceani]MBW0128144.1 GntR family transcriptional regulator [Pseudonocardia oceani]
MEQVRSDRMDARVLGALRAAVISGELAPGSLHSVQALATQLGVSRTPVREALIKLAQLGMVRFERNRGVRVLQTSLHDLEEVFALRLLLEVPATRRACELIDAAGRKELRRVFRAMERAADADDEFALWEHDRHFHRALLQASGNTRLAHYVDGLRDTVLRRGVSTARSSRSLHEIVAEHLVVLERIEASDADGAAAAMRAHVLHTAELLIAQEGGEPAGSLEIDLAWTDGRVRTD